MATQSGRRTTIGAPSAASQAREVSKEQAKRMDPKQKTMAMVAGGVLAVAVGVIGYYIATSDQGLSDVTAVPQDSTTISVTNSCAADAKVSFKVDGETGAKFKGEMGTPEGNTTTVLPGFGKDDFELGDKASKPGAAPAEFEITVVVNGETVKMTFTVERKRRASLAFHDAAGSLRIETGPGIVKKE
jgi:hypothetical protein